MPALACFTLLCALIGGRGALSLLLAGAVLTLPGFALFGRPCSTADACLSALTGLALSSAGIVVAGAMGASFRPLTWLLVSVFASATCLAARRLVGPAEDGAPQVPAIERDPRDRTALLWVVGIALALTVPALFGAGRSIEGAQRFAAFFCADLFKHAAYTGALASGPLPPVDPFSAGDSLRYYWLSYVLPAAALQVGGSPLRAMDLLLGQTLLQTIALATLLFALSRRLGANAIASATATLLGFASLNLDGLAAFLLAPYADLSELVQVYNLEELDPTRLYQAPYHFASTSLYRLCLYVPHHQLAILLLVGWGHLSLRPDAHLASVRAARIALVAVLPVVSLLVAPPALSAIMLYRLALVFLERTVPARRGRVELAFDALALLGAIWLVHAGAVLGAAGDTRPALDLLSADSGPSSRWAWFLPQLFTSFGGMFLLGTLGAFVAYSHARKVGPAHVLPLALLSAAFGCLFLAEVFLPHSDLRINVQLKASFVGWVALVLGSAFVFHELRRPGAFMRGAVVVAALMLGLGVPSIIGDVLWHSLWPWDGPLRKRWHVAVPNADMAALDWTREHVPAAARFVQWPSPSFLEGGVDAWVPVFAGRPVVVAPRAAVRRELRLELARRVFRAGDASQASRLARELDAEYVYLSHALDPGHYARMVGVLSADARLFRLMYSAGQASIWRVM